MIIPPDREKEVEAGLSAVPAAHFPPPPYRSSAHSVSMVSVATTSRLSMIETTPSYERTSTISSDSPATTITRDPTASTSLLTPATSTTAFSPDSHSEKHHHESIAATFGVKLYESVRGRPSPRFRKFWKRYRRLVQVLSIACLLATGLAIGLAVGLSVGANDEEKSHLTGWPNGADSSEKTVLWSPGKYYDWTYNEERDGPPASDGERSQCNEFQPYPADDPFRSLTIPFHNINQSYATFYLPLSEAASITSQNFNNATGSYFVVARGQSAPGSVELVGANSEDELLDGGMQGMIRIDVVVRHLNPDLDDQMRVCRMQRPDGSLGVGIYAPEAPPMEHNVVVVPSPKVSFFIVIRFPKVSVPEGYNNLPTSKPEPRPAYHVDRFSIELDTLSVKVGNMAPIVDFNQWSTVTGRGTVQVGYVAAETIQVFSRQSTIIGTFNISQELTLNTTNGAVLPNVILHNPNELVTSSIDDTSAYYKRASLVNPFYTPSSETAELGRRLAVYDDLAPTNFIKVSAVTTNGPVFLEYNYHPRRTALSSFVSTTSGSAVVKMDPAFVGPFAMRSLWGELRLPLPRDDTIDPTGLSRDREVTVDGGGTACASLNDSSFGSYSNADLDKFGADPSAWEVEGVAWWASTQNQNILKGNTSSTAIERLVSNEMQKSITTAQTTWGDVTFRFDGVH